MSDLNVWVAMGHGEAVQGHLLLIPRLASFATFASHQSVEHWPKWVVTNVETGYKIGLPWKTREQAEKYALATLAVKSRQKIRAAMSKAERENARNGR